MTRVDRPFDETPFGVWLENRTFNVVEIALWMGIPRHAAMALDGHRTGHRHRGTKAWARRYRSKGQT